MTLKKSKKPSDLPVKFWIVTLVAFINSVSFTLVIPILYPYAQQFGLNDFQASLLVTVFAISQFIGTPILGKLSDRFGRKYLLVFSLLGTVLANILASIATAAWLLYFARILDGITGGNNSIATAVISDMTDKSQRAKAFSIFDGVFRLGFVLGPALSYLAQQIPPLPGISNLGMSFLLGAIIAAFATLITGLFLPETLTTKQSINIGWEDFVFTKIFKAATRPKLGKIFILSFLSGFTFTIFTFAFQPFVLSVLGLEPKNLAVIFVILGITGASSQIFTLGTLTKKFNLLNIVFGSLLLRGTIFLLIPNFPYLTAFAILIVIFAAVNPFPMPVLSSIVSLNSSEQEQGEVLGINASYLSMSNAISPAVSGIIVSNFGYNIPFLITGVLTILTALFALSLKSEFECEKKPT